MAVLWVYFSGALVFLMLNSLAYILIDRQGAAHMEIESGVENLGRFNAKAQMAASSPSSRLEAVRVVAESLAPQGHVISPGNPIASTGAIPSKARRPFAWLQVDGTSEGAPLARACHTLVAYMDGFYLVGGDPGSKNNRKKLNQLYYFNATSRTWSGLLHPVGTGPRGFYYHSASLANERIYVFGGGRGSKVKSSDFAAYSISRNAWYPITAPNAPFERYAHVTAIISDKLYLFGGRTPKKLSNELFDFDLNLETWTMHQVLAHLPPSYTRNQCSFSSRRWLWEDSDLKNFGTQPFFNNKLSATVAVTDLTNRHLEMPFARSVSTSALFWGLAVIPQVS
eukprot:NODE_1094_length_1709_cov_47.130120_g970_i0.p1 GENE.NODE_1094_length_1709_cov_47.130120_g970_i0~~NODE_1094_length_1709_cov_47.130120_g970_i0.p1  ORF type:complete len:364 (-),score=59.26 NODE_1094_length_1709_cov_47.130120_g970_i0:618-1634(-)